MFTTSWFVILIFRNVLAGANNCKKSWLWKDKAFKCDNKEKAKSFVNKKIAVTELLVFM